MKLRFNHSTRIAVEPKMGLGRFCIFQIATRDKLGPNYNANLNGWTASTYDLCGQVPCGIASVIILLESVPESQTRQLPRKSTLSLEKQIIYLQRVTIFAANSRWIWT